MKGLCFILLSVIAVVLLVLFATLYDRQVDEWCDGSMNAGDCAIYRVDDASHCFCIDQNVDDLKNGELGIYEHSREQCELLNGTLATPEDEELLLELAKRMFKMGVDQSYIGLKKIESNWVWTKKNGSQPTSDLHWRFFPEEDTEYSHAAITVETIEIDDENNENAFVYYNYNFYIENDNTYNWYGFKPASNIYDPSKPKNGYYYICHYAEKPSNSLIQTTTIATNNQTSKEKEEDRCYCSSNVQIELSALEDSYSFSSPDYPNNYCSDSNCRWIFSTAEDLVFKLEWIVFSTENEFDVVNVIDGGERNDPLITTCNGVRCPDEQSSGNKIQIHFSSDHVTTDIGFKGQVTVISPDKCYCSERTTINFDNIEDSHAFNSPDTYCINQFCSWIFTGPEGNGLSIRFDTFELQATDFLHIYDHSDLIRNCTGNDCPPFISWSESVRIEYISDHLKSKHKGFAAVVKSVPNYCEKEKLHVPLGRVNYTRARERTDGNIAIGESATVTCEPNSKIEGTVESVRATSYCTEHGWTQLAICVTVCVLETETPEDGKSAYVCKFQDPTDFKLVKGGNHITRSEYRDMKDGWPPPPVSTVQDNRKLDSNNTVRFTCNNESTWEPETPKCHSTMGVLLLGGGAKSKYRYKEVPEYKGVELYSPIESKSIQLDIANLSARSHHLSLLLDGGKLLMAGGYKEGEERPNSQEQPGSRTTDLIDLQTLEVVRGPPMLVGRLNPAAAILNGKPVVCGGYKPGPEPEMTAHYAEFEGQTLYSDCEALLEGVWMNITHMPIARSAFALVALNDCLFAIGGETVNEANKAAITNQVHKYCPNISDDWTEVTAMHHHRMNFAAAIFEDIIMVCGSEQNLIGIVERIGYGLGKDACEKYNPITDEWQGAFAPELKMKKWNRHSFSMVALDGRLYAFGGAFISDADKKSVEYFEDVPDGDHHNFQIHGWQEVLVQPREGPGAYVARYPFELVEPREYSSSAVVPLMESWDRKD